MSVGGIMWLENLKEIKHEKGLHTKDIAEKAGLPIKTVERIFSGKTTSPMLDTLERLATALGVSLREILSGTHAVIGDKTLAESQQKVDILTVERDLLLAENAELKMKVGTITEIITENKILKIKLAHAEELLAVHDFYNHRK